MQKTKKKKLTTLGGQPGEKSKASVTEEELSAVSEAAQAAKQLTKKAGEILGPDGWDHVGSASIHYFSKSGLQGPMYAHMVHLVVENLEEAHAGLGVQTLRGNLMEAFGQRERKRGE